MDSKKWNAGLLPLTHRPKAADGNPLPPANENAQVPIINPPPNANPSEQPLWKYNLTIRERQSVEPPRPQGQASSHGGPFPGSIRTQPFHQQHNNAVTDEQRGRTNARSGSPGKSLFLPPRLPIPQQAIDIDLSRVLNAGGVKPKTTCHLRHDLKHQGYHHLLQCGHVVYTKTKQSCANNCAKFAPGGERTNAINFECPVTQCARRTHVALKGERATMTNNRALRKCKLSETLGAGYDSTDVRVEEARRAMQEMADEKEALLKAQEELPRGRTQVRERSMSPNALAASRQDNYRDRDPLASRDGRYNQSMGRSASMGPRGDGIFIAHDNAAGPGYTPANDNPRFTRHRGRKVKVERTEPLNWNEQNFGSTTEKFAFDWSVSEETYNALVKERGTPEPDEEPQPAFEEDPSDDPNEEIVPLQGDAEERYCVCEQLADEHLVRCTQCQHYYHPVCVGKAKGDLFHYDNDGRRNEVMRADAEYWRSNFFRCAECDTKRKTRAAMREEVVPERKTTIAEMRYRSVENRKTFQSDIGAVEKFSPAYSVQVRTVAYKEWGRHPSQLAPGVSNPQKTKNWLNEIASNKIAAEKEAEHKRAKSIFRKFAVTNGKFVCDHCDYRIVESRHLCTVCKNHDLCLKCFHDPAATFKHQCGLNGGDVQMS